MHTGFNFEKLTIKNRRRLGHKWGSDVKADSQVNVSCIFWLEVEINSPVFKIVSP